MTYVPQPPDAFFPPYTPGYDAAFDVLWANHNEVRDAYEQTIATCAVGVRTQDGNPLLWRFRQRGNAGLGDVVVIIEVEQSGGGTFKHTVSDGVSSVSDFTVGAGTHVVTLALAPAAAEGEYELEVFRQSGGGHVDVLGWVAYGERASDPSLVPGWRDAPATNPWLVADEPIAEEHVERLSNGPGALAKDRPHCLLFHGWPDGPVPPKNDDNPTYQTWGWTGSVARAGHWQQAGHGLVEVTGLVPRTIVVDAWVIASGTAAATVSIGAVAVAVTPGSWQRFTVTLAPGLHEVVATLQVNGNNEFAYFHALHVWRL